MWKQIVKPFQYPRFNFDQINNRFVDKHRPKVTAVHSRHAPKQVQKPKRLLATIKRIWTYLATSKRKLTLVMIMVILSSVMALLGPFLVGRAVDWYIVEKNHSGMIYFLIGLGIVYILHAASVLLQNFWMIGIAQQTVYRMRLQLFQHLHRLPIPYFDKRQHGELMSRVTNDIDNISNTLNSSVIQIFTSVLTFIGTVSVMLWLSPLLTLITFLVIPLMVFGLKWITRRTGKLFKAVQANLGELNGYIEETISGQPIVKTFSQEKRVISEFKQKNQQLKHAGFWAQTFSGFIPKLMNGLNHLNFTIVAAIGGYLAIQGVISIGVIVIFAEYTRQFTRPLSDLANQFNTLLSAIAGAERVFEVLDEEEERKDEQQAKELLEIKGDVRFVHVSFCYEKEKQTIMDVNFHVKPGETVALVGPTGAGKNDTASVAIPFL